ncbi:MAG: SRPBCC domain-containing protein [Acidobacteriota bacterium]
MPADAPSSFDHSILISAPSERVLEAFFDPGALAVWWQTTRSVTTPRPLGVYAVEWEPTPDADDVLGPLGGVFYGIVMEFIAGHELFVADAWWLPPDGEPIGPMSFHVTCTVEAAACRLRIRQSGFEDGARWRRYYSVIERGWHISMAALKEFVETGARLQPSG